MNNKLIQVTATEGGFKWNTRHELTEWQQHSNQFKALGRGWLFYPRTTNAKGEADPNLDRFHHIPYVRPKRPNEPQVIPIAYVKRDLPTHPYLRARMLHYGR